MLKHFQLFKNVDDLKNNIKIIIINKFYELIITNKIFKLKVFLIEYK